MKASILRTLITLGISAVLGSVILQAQDRIHVTVPFDFSVGSKSFPAGDYLLGPVTPAAPMVLAIRRSDGSSVGLTQTFGAAASPVPGSPRVTFNRYGEQYFLSKIAGDGRGWELPVSPAEKETIAKTAAAHPVVLVASSK